MDVGDWLGSLGLGQYLALFREHAIDAEVLPDLTDADLEKFGVPFGHRKRLIKAIAKLGAVAPEQAKAPLQSSATILPDASAERRHLTVMFVDLVGSTVLSARLDPEDMREVIAAYHKCCANLIQTGGGFVAKFMGDGVLAYFGYPRAQEQDAENAVKAGLAIAEAAPTLDTVAGAPLHVRVGIATGIVVVGDLLGSGEGRSAESWATRRTSRRGCRRSPSRTWLLSPRGREDCSAICSNSTTSGRWTSRALRSRCGPLRRCE